MELSPNHNLLEAKDLKIYFPILRGLLKKKVAEVKAVDGVSFNIRRGETLGLVGESGCGKTTTGRGVARLCEPTAGQVFFQGQDILQLTPAKMKNLRRNISIIFQDPYGSLDPRQTAGDIVGEPLLTHQMVHNKKEYKETVEGLFKKVGLDPFMIQRVPHEFSGGQRQRIGIARALACKPSLVICDEPISALDVSIQAQIINLFNKLQEDMEGLTYFFIAHDLSVVKHISDRIAVMYLGRIVEITHSDDLYHSPLHPYTKALLSAVPIADPLVERKRERIFLRGEVPSPLNPPPGCSFHPRCSQAMKKCSLEAPALRSVGNGHEVSCHLV